MHWMLALIATALPRLVVPGMEGHGVGEDLRAALTDALVADVRRQAPAYDVLGGNEVQSLLRLQAVKQQLGCHSSQEVSCLVELGGALGASRMVFGTLDRVGKSYFLDLKLIDVAHARVLRESTSTPASEDELLAAIERAARAILLGGAGGPLSAEASPPQVAPQIAHTSVPSPQAGSPSVASLSADGAKVFSGPDGLEVDLVWLKPRASNRVLVRVTGGTSPFEGKVLVHTFEDRGAQRLTTQWRGRAWTTVVGSARLGGQGLSWEVYVPGRRDGLQIIFDKQATASLRIDSLLADYVAQRDSGALAELARFDRLAEQRQQDQEYAALAAEAAQSCGLTVTGQIDWASVSDDVLKRFSVASYCGGPLAALRRGCAEEAGFKRRLLGPQVIRCRFGDGLALELTGGHLLFTTAVDAANQEDWARERLHTLLRPAN